MTHRLLLCCLPLTWLVWGCQPELPSDLTLDIAGTYTGTLTLHLDTDSAQDVPNVRLAVVRVDDETVQLTPLDYPAASPLAGQALSAQLTRSPDGFVRTEGVVLTIGSVSLPDGSAQGVPFAGPVATGPEQHGRYVRESGSLLYTVQLLRNGVDTYELFDGQRD